MKKIVTVLGARPQFVKAAVLSRVIKKHNTIEEVIVHTGQHFDTNMSAVFFEEMKIPTPAYNLDINNMRHGAMTGQMIEEIEKVLEIEKPDALVVYGDTNSTIAGALAAKKMHIKVVHIEAGLRSYNMKMTEEINGDIMKDAVEYYSQFSKDKSSIIKDHKLQTNEFVLATIHRQENTDDTKKLSAVFTALEEIHKTQPVVLPLHPRTKAILDKLSIQPKIHLIDPVGYYSMLELLKNCSMVITDSGGLQKEAFFNKKQCIVVRDETEWVELVAHEFAKLVGCNTKKILQTFKTYKSFNKDFSIELYGTDVGEKIYQSIYQLIH